MWDIKFDFFLRITFITNKFLYYNSFFFILALAIFTNLKSRCLSFKGTVHQMFFRFFSPFSDILFLLLLYFYTCWLLIHFCYYTLCFVLALDVFLGLKGIVCVFNVKEQFTQKCSNHLFTVLLNFFLKWNIKGAFLKNMFITNPFLLL